MANAIRFQDQKGRTRWQPQVIYHGRRNARAYRSLLDPLWLTEDYPTNARPVLCRSRRVALWLAKRHEAHVRRLNRPRVYWRETEDQEGSQ